MTAQQQWVSATISCLNYLSQEDGARNVDRIMSRAFREDSAAYQTCQAINSDAEGELPITFAWNTSSRLRFRQFDPTFRRVSLTALGSTMNRLAASVPNCFSPATSMMGLLDEELASRQTRK
jgi:hypothetical protein